MTSPTADGQGYEAERPDPADTCPECLSPFIGSHFGDCRIATGMKPSPPTSVEGA